MSKFLDFPLVYGKLGNHPGSLTTEQAVALFNTAMRCPIGAKLIECWPDTGRSTVILSAAVKNLEGKLYVFTNFDNGNKAGEGWFHRAIKTHRLDVIIDHPTPSEVLDNPADLAVMPAGGLVGSPGLLRAKRLFIIGSVAVESIDGYKGVEYGAGYSVWEEAVMPLNEALVEGEHAH